MQNEFKDSLTNLLVAACFLAGLIILVVTR